MNNKATDSLICLTTQDITRPFYGGSKSVYGSLMTLSKHRVRVIAVIPSCGPFRQVRLSDHLIVFFIPSCPKEGLISLARSLYCRLPYKVAKYHSGVFRAHVEKIIEKERPKQLLVHGSHLAKLGLQLSTKTGLPMVFRPHNVEYALLKQYANYCPFLWRPLVRWQARAMRIFEQKIWQRSDKVCFISDRDFKVAERDTRVSEDAVNQWQCVYDGVKVFNQKVRYHPHSFLMSGATNVIQNVVSTRWFLREIWSLFFANKQAFDRSASLTMVGVDSRDFYRLIGFDRQSLNEMNVSIIGKVENFQEAVAGHRFFISPTLIGSGYRVKLAEAAAAGTSLMTTDLDVSALAFLQPGKNCHAFSDADDFSQAYRCCIENPKQEKQMRTTLFEDVQKHMNWDEHVKGLLS